MYPWRGTLGSNRTIFNLFFLTCTLLVVLHLLPPDLKPEKHQINKAWLYIKNASILEDDHLEISNPSFDWQEITEFGGSARDNNTPKFFVYSAFLDFHKNPNIIRVVAVAPSYTQADLYCHIFDKKYNQLGVLPGTIDYNKDTTHGYEYSSSFILCDIDSIQNKRMSLNKSQFFEEMKFIFVSPTPSISSGFSITPISKLSNILTINVPPGEEKPSPHEFAICVQPMFDYDKVFDFIQWLEFNKMMGVTHFTFYNISIGPRVSCIMKSKAVNKDSPVVVLNWTPPIPDYTRLHVSGQNAQGTDCAFRYRELSKYVVSVDVDEYIVPNYVHTRNYHELIEYLDANKTIGDDRPTAQYLFLSVFYASDFGSYPSSAFNGNRISKNGLVLEDLTIYKYVLRQKDLYPYGTRSKFITVPKLVIEPGTHMMAEAVGNATEMRVPPEAAFIHHYRHYGCGTNCSKESRQTDFSAHFFAQTLLKNVKTIMGALQDECGLGS